MVKVQCEYVGLAGRCNKMCHDSRKEQRCYCHYGRESLPQCLNCARGTQSTTGYCGKCTDESQTKMLKKIFRTQLKAETGKTYVPNRKMCEYCNVSCTSIKGHRLSARHIQTAKYRALFISEDYNISTHLALMQDLQK